MKKTLKIFTASVLTACLALTTAVCCCVGPVVMAHLKKAAVCSHCPPQGPSHGHSSDPTDGCMYRLTNAEASQAQIIVAPAQVVFTPTVFFDKQIAIPFLPSSIQAYPRGSPPLAASLIPPYLRTFNLRI